MHRHQTDPVFDVLIERVLLLPVKPRLILAIAAENERASKRDSSATSPRKYNRVAPAWNKKFTAD